MKKGVQAIWPIMMMTIVMTFAIVLMLFIKKTGDVGMSEADKTACKTSILAHSKTGSEISCPLKTIKITSSKEDDMRGAFVNAMAECWDNYGQGNNDVFTSGSPDSYCAVCSVVEFKHETKLKEVPFFIASKHFRVAGKRTNYYDFFTGDYSDQEELISLRTSPMYIDTTEKYVIMFAQRPTQGEKSAFFVDPLTLTYSSMSLFNQADLYDLGISVDNSESSDKIIRLDVNKIDSPMVSGITAIVLNSEYLYGMCDNFPVSLVGIEDNVKEV